MAAGWAALRAWLDGEPARAVARAGASASAPVGLLWVVFEHASSRGPRRSAEYVRQAVRSAGTARALNPGLPRAIATNVGNSDEALHLTFDIVARLALRSSGASPWLPRLIALGASPFDLTLELDSSVTICSSALESRLRHEYHLNRFDVAVNFEASPLKSPDPSSMLGPPPRHLSDMLPHNFALLVRKGRGWAEVLRLWLHMIKRRPDDQVALRAVLRALDSQHLLLKCSTSRTKGCGANVVRIWRLAETLLAFKSADKRTKAWRMIWPR